MPVSCSSLPDIHNKVAIILCYPDGLGRMTTDRLYAPSAALPAASDQIWSAHWDAQKSWRWTKALALTVAVLGCLPWCWYFLLRRIAQLRAAIGDKACGD